MSFRSLLRSGWLCGLLAAGCAGPNHGAGVLKVYIMTDLEGASGVYRFAQTRETGTPPAEQAKEYLMDDLREVIRGLRDGGVTGIVALDGHGTQAFVPHLMEPGATYITGLPRPGPMCGLDDTFAGLAMVACHAMMGTPDGVLHHTQSSRSEARYWYNGVESGELVQFAAIAGHYGVPPILVTGDEATCRESRRFFGPECVTVAVKRGISREAAELYPFAETRRALYEGARRAVAAIPRCKPYRLALPIAARKQYLVFDGPSKKGRLETREATLDSLLRVIDF